VWAKLSLSRVLSKELFESEEAMIRLDMSEYMEKHAVSKLIGLTTWIYRL
jgi:ATP-dependent Clp protease ATP-binding subunit ClpA